VKSEKEIVAEIEEMKAQRLRFIKKYKQTGNTLYRHFVVGLNGDILKLKWVLK